MSRSLNLGSISTRLRWIAHLAREDPQRSFLSLAHYIDEFWLMEAYSRTRKDGAAGIDGQTAKQYAEDLAGNLRSLLDRFKSGLYRAPPVRRVEIPKGSGSETRPIGIPTFEDKVLQRAVTMVLEAIYEEDFLDCSYGFRPNRSALDAITVLRKELTEMGGGWVLEVDIQSLFRRARPRPSTVVSRQEGARRCDSTCDWEMAQGRSHGKGSSGPPENGDSSRRGRLACACQYLPPRGRGSVV